MQKNYEYTFLKKEKAGAFAPAVLFCYPFTSTMEMFSTGTEVS